MKSAFPNKEQNQPKFAWAGFKRKASTLCGGLTLMGLWLNASSAMAQDLKHDSYLDLNGVNQYLSVPSHSDFDALAGKSYTYTFWLYGYNTYIYGDAQRIISRRDIGKKAVDSLNRSGYDIIALRNTSNTFVGANLVNAAGTATGGFEGWGAFPGDRALLRAWYHCALVVNREDNTIKLYIDGKEVRNTDKEIRAWVAENKLPLLIGAGLKDNKTMAYFAGRIDNLRFYHKALNDKELAVDSQTERIDPKTEGLVAAFDFDGLQAGASTYTDETGRHTATLHGFPAETGHSLIKTYVAHRTNGHLVGRSSNQALSVFTLGINQPEQLEMLEVETPGESQVKNVLRYRLYLTDNADRYDNRKAATLIAEGRPSVGVTTLKAVKNAPKLTKYSHLWLVADVAPQATEGDAISTRIKMIKLGGGEPFAPKSDTYRHEIVLQRVLVWSPTENHSAHYRIPSIIRLKNGNLVAGIDKRKTTDYDLPSDIDVEVKISKDNGRTWSKPITVAKGNAQYGYGDAAMATDGQNIYMVMVAGSGLWFYPSSAKKPLDMFFSHSADGGLTWSKPVDITAQVYTDRYPNGGFFGSGNGIITSKGRIAFVAAMRTDAKWGGNMDNVMVYSDDKGKTWHASTVARANGDESKVLELENGDLLISSRNRPSNTPRTYVLSHDHGATWSEPKVWQELVGNACNAALTRYSLASEGKGAENIILHTLLASPTRHQLTLYMSRDEAKTWEVCRKLCDGEAAYSEVTRLKNGNIGIISEEDDRPAYDIYFTEVSLDWLKKGQKPLDKPQSK